MSDLSECLCHMSLHSFNQSLFNFALKEVYLIMGNFQTIKNKKMFCVTFFFIFFLKIRKHKHKVTNKYVLNLVEPSVIVNDL